MKGMPVGSVGMLEPIVVSFVIPAYNEEVALPRTLGALNQAAESSGEAFEVLVVDDASTDNTPAVARAHGAKVVSARRRQIAGSRNAGAAAAAGEFLIFVDADTVVSPEAVRAAIGAMRNGATGGGCAFRFDRPMPLYGRIMEAFAPPAYRLLGLASGCFLFCTRTAFDAAGGFDETLFGAEEAAMSRVLRRQGRFVILREQVTTSARKLRSHSAGEILGLLVKLAFTGGRSLRRRDGLDLWYGPRRADPGGG